MQTMLQATIERNDKLAYRIIGIVSVVVFLVVAALPKLYLGVTVSFDPHVFAKANAIINTTVTILLILGFILVRQKKYEQHRSVMLTAILLSGLFLVSYIAHHLFALETKFGGEGTIRYFYFFIL